MLRKANYSFRYTRSSRAKSPNSVFFESQSPESLASLLADWLQHLSPEPDLSQEAIARVNNTTEVQAFGYRFLEIVKDC